MRLPTGVAESLAGLGEGLGRRIAALALAMFVVLQLGAPALFAVPRQALFDAYQNLMPRLRDPRMAPVVIVTIDNATLKAEGEWPWPRERLARLIDAILAAHPAALGLDIILPRSSPQVSPGAETGAAGDAALARAISAGSVVVGVLPDSAGTFGSGPGDEGPFAPAMIAGAVDAPGGLPSYPSQRRSSPVIDLAASGHGLLANAADPDGVFRRLQLVSVVGGQVASGLGLEVYRLAAQAPAITLYTAHGRTRAVGVGSSRFPVDPDGSLRIDFAAPESFEECSAEGLLRARRCAARFGGAPIALDGRVVLLGLDADGVGDTQRKTPLGPMAGVEVQAQGLDNLFAGQFPKRPAWAALCEAMMTLVLGLFLIAALPAARPGWRPATALAPLILLGAGGAFLWLRLRWLTDVATPAIGCGVLFVALLAGGLAQVDAQRRRLRRELEIRRLSAARAEGELEAGRRIQMGILPTPRGLAPDSRFDLDAVMVPARQIGGDLYDFFMIDTDRLFFAVGDVSGKGLPASLFMALGKSLCKSCALRGETDIGAIVRRANAEISRDNPEMLFITLFAGILDLRTGEMDFCNAGHDAPFLVSPGLPPRAVPAEGGPPLCVVDDFPYLTETRRLAEGDLLCIMTDGVTEAMTDAGELMGRDAVERVLGRMDDGLSARDVTLDLQAAVARFVAGAEPSDDLTILTIRWNGPG